MQLFILSLTCSLSGNQPNMKIYIYIFFPCLQVHGLDPDTWKDVEVVYIDIADKRQIDSKVCDLKKTNKPSLGVIILFILNL